MTRKWEKLPGAEHDTGELFRSTGEGWMIDASE